MAYSFQIYFDFSGYSDMALGLSRMFNVELPVNFASPYKAQSIIDFWCRWHISLSSFLRDYLYIPLGGSHNGEMRRHGNLMITMLLGGLWHGASWGFVIWGGLHGLFLVINHLWRAGPRMALQWFANVKRSWIEAGVCILLALSASSISLSYGCVVLVLLLPGWLWRNFLTPEDDGARQWSAGVIRVMLTFIVVTLSWVFFRSTNLTAVNEMLQGMSDANGLSHNRWEEFRSFGVLDVKQACKVLFAAAPLVWLAPDSNRVSAFLVARGRWGALGAGLILLFCMLRIGKPSEFLYFQF